MINMKIQFSTENITVFESQWFRTTSTLIALSESIIIVDPNWTPHEIDDILSYIDNNFPHHRQYLFFTHSDFDHILGYGAFPKAYSIASGIIKKNKNQDKILDDIRSFDNQQGYERSYPLSYPKIDIAIDKIDQKIIIDNVEMYFYNVGGHTADGTFMIIPALNIWIAGDHLSNIEIPIIDDNLDNYRETINLSEQIFRHYDNISILVTGHGDVANQRTQISQRIENDKTYLNLLDNMWNSEYHKALLELISQYGDAEYNEFLHQENIQKVKVKYE